MLEAILKFQLSLFTTNVDVGCVFVAVFDGMVIYVASQYWRKKLNVFETLALAGGIGWAMFHLIRSF